MKDYYKILNVSKTATDDEIKRSYRVLAKKYHPDVNPGDQKAADIFADINEAYDVISDSAKRAEYDRKVKEANAPKPSREDIMAQQRAAAQAAARQAAARQAAMRDNVRERMRSGETPLSMAQRVAAARAAAAQAAAAQAQAQAQAQVSAIEKKAYDVGYARGKADAKAECDREISSLKSDNRALNAKLSISEKKLAETERDRSELENELFTRDREINLTKSDRSELEQELFNRDRELTQAKARAEDLMRQIELLRQRPQTAATTVHTHEQPSEDVVQLKTELEEYKEKCRQLEQERNQAELKNQAQIELQLDKRRQLQEQIDSLTHKVDELTAENEELRTENEQWQQYAKSEDFISDAERRMQEWETKQKADKKLAKPTHYGTLGVLIWAEADEIDEAYNKLVKRYGGRDDEVSVDKVAHIEEAYAVLSDSAKRVEYNESIGITEERVAEERRLIDEFEKMEEEYRNRLADKKFWEHFDELTFNAETGDAEAQNELGEMYYYGDEIDQDFEQAAYWFKEAAKQKHAEAMYHLGVCFINGEGVERNETTGMGFIRQAAKLGSKEAQTFKFE